LEPGYDFVAIALFCGIAILYLRRSATRITTDSAAHYIPPIVGCALVDWLGNHGQDLLALLMLGSVVAYTLTVLKPLGRAI
jgi:hypothetical protein